MQIYYNLRFYSLEVKQEHVFCQAEKTNSTAALLAKLDYHIKRSLHPTKPEFSKAIKALDNLSGLPIARLTLEQHPYIVQTIKKLVRYIGPKDSLDHKAEQKVTHFLDLFLFLLILNNLLPYLCNV